MQGVGLGHPNTRWLLSNLASMYSQAGRAADAEKLLRELLASQPKPVAPDSSYAQVLFRLGNALVFQQKYADAEPFLREAWLIQRAVQPDHWGTYSAQSTLGKCLLAQRKFDGAASLLVEGYEGLKSVQAQIPAGGRNQLLRDVQADIVRLYEQWGFPEQAAEWRARAPTSTTRAAR